ncbi:MAG: hypothetical protein AABZ53_15005 [Planctomycetota bacterium]
MSTRAVLIVLALAALLSIVTAVSLRPKGVDYRPQPVLAGEVSLCKAFKATHADGSRQEFALDVLSGEWIMSSFDKAGVGGRDWSVPESRVKGALRLLDEAKTLGIILGGEERQGTSVEFSLPTGPPVTLLLEPDGLGGRVAAKISQDGTPERRVFVPTSIAELFRKENLAEWRDTGLLSTQLGDPSRIAINRRDRQLKLTRVGKNWSVQEPLGVPADTRSVLKLISAIAKLRLDRFESGPQDRSAPPELSLTIETDLPPGKGGGEERLTASETLRFWCRDPGDELWHAGVESRVGVREQAPQILRGNAAGPIQSASLRSISLDPADYVSRIAFAELSQADIASISLGKIGGTTPGVLTRRGTSWSDGTPGAELSTGDRAKVAALLTLICETPASAVRLDPPGTAATAELTFRSASGQSLGVAIFALPPQAPERNSSPDKPLLWFGNGQVWRGYDPGEPGLSDWILANLR